MSEDVFLGGGNLAAASAWSNGLPGPSTVAILPNLPDFSLVLGTLDASVVSVAAGANYLIDNKPGNPALLIATLELASGASVTANRSPVVIGTLDVADDATFKMDGAPANDLGVALPPNGQFTPSVTSAQGGAWAVDHGFPSVPLSGVIGDLQHAAGSEVNLNGTVAIGTVGIEGAIPPGTAAAGLGFGYSTSVPAPAAAVATFFPAAPPAETLEWVGLNPQGTVGIPLTVAIPEFLEGTNWLSLNEPIGTGRAPDSAATLIFTSGTHDVYELPFDTQNASSVVLDSDAVVSLHMQPGAFVTSHLTVNSLTLESGATLTVGGLTANTVDLQPGAALDFEPSPADGSFNGVTINTLENNGGIVNWPKYPNDLLGGVPDFSLPPNQPYLTENFSSLGLPFDGVTGDVTGGLLSGQDVLPTPDTLELNLGTVMQGASLDPLTFNVNDLGNTDTMIGLGMVGTAGSGFTVTIGPAGSVSEGFPYVEVNIDTSVAGAQQFAVKFSDTYQTKDFYDSHGFPSTQSGADITLLLSDSVVATPAGTPSVTATSTGNGSATSTGGSVSGGGSVSSTGSGSVTGTGGSGSGSSVAGTGGGISVSGSSSVSGNGSVSGSGSGSVTGTGGSGGPVPCFVEGTQIATPAGWVAAEKLRPGDAVRTASGRIAAVRWIGWQAMPPHGEAGPIRIVAGAISPGVPLRDVRLSPDHAVFIDGVLIPAHRLANGTTIRHEYQYATLTYVHVELDRHDVLLAEGLPVESYLDTGNRSQFAAERGVRPLLVETAADPMQAAMAAYRALACAPLHLNGPGVTSAHARLFQRALAMGWRLTDNADLTVSGDLPRVRPLASQGTSKLLFEIPAGVSQVHLHSRFFTPAEMNTTTPDRRRLGVALTCVTLNGVPLPDDAYCAGFHPPEQAWRWTDGEACLRIPKSPRPATLHLEIADMNARYWVRPSEAVCTETEIPLVTDAPAIFQHAADRENGLPSGRVMPPANSRDDGLALHGSVAIAAPYDPSTTQATAPFAHVKDKRAPGAKTRGSKASAKRYSRGRSHRTRLVQIMAETGGGLHMLHDR